MTNSNYQARTRGQCPPPPPSTLGPPHGVLLPLHVLAGSSKATVTVLFGVREKFSPASLMGANIGSTGEETGKRDYKRGCLKAKHYNCQRQRSSRRRRLIHALSGVGFCRKGMSLDRAWKQNAFSEGALCPLRYWDHRRLHEPVDDFPFIGSDVAHVSIFPVVECH
jgi:hypothetical protein